ncbi:hypothetical protein ACQKWADRAFT_324639 [Trichoderma austrokoningii]
MRLPTVYAALLSAFVGTALGYDADFTVYPNADCSNGGGTTIIGSVGAKDQFWPNQRSVRVNSIRNGKHVALYLGGSQSGAVTRLYDPDGCINGDWLSYGIYNGGP